ncbi:hypothetical protein [Solitalea canadensis]|uniref:Uncharacterized protein n=1 Tax=Solitalea canadensis (strain ATCC 29591 / DSM 3403 / JCM 21819 / LMG 8368 / NBRC 15130 / NCIMB 12057 / USAM 9D) TaxID=929556 RepID=H8KMI7_SOLCM|nr:hypothetical protein [Solitalea canadensis]AFD08782.1 hypothetical protein Solca_3782 [Solitalea canadensis DSM 3403]
MNFFKIKTSWSNAEFIPFKLCIGSAYLIIGAYFHNFFQSYYVLILVLFGITVIWTMAAWIKKMKDHYRVNPVTKENDSR